MKKISYGVLLLFVSLGLVACIPLPRSKQHVSQRSTSSMTTTEEISTTTEQTTTEAVETTDKYKYTQESNGIEQDVLVSLTYKGSEYQTIKIDMTHTFPEEQQAQMRALDPAIVQEVLEESLSDDSGMSDLMTIEGVSVTGSLTADYKWLVSIVIDMQKADGVKNR
ncbi:hypothetical protein AB3331_07540 [Streptococcus sp. H49]|uniref:hypothetical protein n=1 Tax=Streptococcus huangxiaojuni TaxID=3237239 RepID=UPI0034A3C4E5